MTARFLAPRSLLASLSLAWGVHLGTAHAQPRPPVRPPPARPAPAATPAPAAAQPAADPALLDARRAYEEGTAHFNAGRYAEALTAFQRAYELRPNAVVLLPILESQERLDQVGPAIATLERYMRDAPETVDRAPLQTRLAALQQRPGHVTVTSEPPGARVRVDGAAREGVTPIELDLARGDHAIDLSLTGHASASQSVSLEPGARTTVALRLTPEAAPTPPVTAAATPTPASAPVTTPPRNTSPVVWVAAGLAGVGLIAGTVFGVMALSDSNEYNNAPSRELLDRGERNAVLSDVGFGTAIAAGAVAVVVYFAGRGQADAAPPQSAAVHPGLRLNPTGLTLRF